MRTVAEIHTIYLGYFIIHSIFMHIYYYRRGRKGKNLMAKLGKAPQDNECGHAILNNVLTSKIAHTITKLIVFNMDENVS